jgi:hypothetical protein
MGIENLKYIDEQYLIIYNIKNEMREFINFFDLISE